MATEANFTFVLGETWEIDFELNDLAGDDLDLTLGTVEFRMSSGDTIVLELSTDTSPGGIGLNSPPTGNGVVTVEPGDQTLIASGSYPYEVRATLADGRVTTQGFGIIVVQASLF